MLKKLTNLVSVVTLVGLSATTAAIATDKPATESTKEATKPVTPAPAGEKILVIISHTVADYDKWKPGYDSMEPLRQQNGIKVLGLYRSADNPNDVTILEEATDIAKLKEIFSSPDLAAKMKEHGVTSKPDIRYLKEAK